MFRKTDGQGSLFEPIHFMTEEKRKRLDAGWSGQFRDKVLPMIDEELFRDMFCADNGRPNKSASMVAGILILKEMFDLTDEETVERVDFDLQWQTALRLTPEDAHCCQKTLHNFRVKLLDNPKAQTLFETVTGQLIDLLGLSTRRQRLDSTHIISNIKILTRLGLFCETIRVFLKALKRSNAAAYESVPAKRRLRYLKDDGGETRFEDVQTEKRQRRLDTCGRDLYRLSRQFRNDPAVASLAEFQILERLLSEQCEIRSSSVPGKTADDADEGSVPVQVKESKEVASSSLQSPHDAHITYSGHKGKGDETQIAETVGNGDKPEMITYVEVTPSCGSDAQATIPAVDSLAQRNIQPEELLADTNYGSVENAIECAKRGTDLIAPVAGAKVDAADETKKTLADFVLNAVEPAQPMMCPAGHAPESHAHYGDNIVRATYAKIHCKDCPFKKHCPSKRNPDGSRTIRTTVKEYVLAKRRRFEASGEFRKKYAPRAGVEGTNSELKRGHGLGRLRVRGKTRVKQSVTFKALGCNVKRAVRYLAKIARNPAA